MGGLRVVRTKGTRYSIDVTCPKCSGELAQENQNKEDKFYRVFALYCDNCRTTFSFAAVLRTEQTSHPSGVKLEGSRYGKTENAVPNVQARGYRTGVYRSSPQVSRGKAEQDYLLRKGDN